MPSRQQTYFALIWFFVLSSLIHIFENVNDIKLNYKIGDRRKGDVISAYADTTKIKEELNWSTKYSLENALKSAWNWELNLNKHE